MTARTLPTLLGSLLVLYPRWFRREYAADIREAMERELGAAGFPGVRHVAGLTRDLLVTLGKAWLATLRSGPSERGAVSGKGLITGSGGFRGWGHDVRFALKGLRRRPGLALAAVATLAVGIGLTAAMFSIVQGLALRGLPLEDGHEVVAVRRLDPRQGAAGRVPSRLHDFRDLQASQTSLDGLVAWQGAFANLADDQAPPDAVGALNVSWDFFEVLRVAPARGRSFRATDAEPGAAPTAIISHDLWTNRFGGSADAVGSTVRINGAPTTIVGILAPGFEFPWNTALWMPLRLDPATLERGQGPPLWLVGRLREGVTEEQAAAELTLLAEQLGEQFPDTDGGYRMIVREWTADFLGPTGQQALFGMLLAVSLVLVLACVNVANLLLVRAVGAAREMAVRSALGAGRGRLMRQALFDAFLLALLGATGGVLIAIAGADWYNRAMADLAFSQPFYVDVRVDAGVLAFVSALTVAAALLSAILPVLQAGRVDPHGVLNDAARAGAGRRVGRVSRVLVVAQVTIACALLVGAGLLGLTIRNLQSLDLGLRPESVLTGIINLPASDYSTQEARAAFHSELLVELGSLPGAEAVALATDVPLAGFASTRFGLAGQSYPARAAPRARLARVSDGYFEVFGIEPIRGRLLDPADANPGRPVAVVTRSFASRHLGGEGVGARIVLAPEPDEVAPAEAEIEVVGVVEDMYAAVPAPPLPPEAILMPLGSAPAALVNVMVRGAGDPMQLAGPLRSRVADIDADLPVGAIATLREAVLLNNYYIEIFGALFGVFGLASLLLAAVGVYGVMAFATAQRRHEMGVRLALGSAPGGVTRLVLRQGMLRVAAGVGLGLLLSRVLVGAVGSMLFGVATGQVAVFAVVATALLFVGAIAAWLPARRAAATDPATTLAVD